MDIINESKEQELHEIALLVELVLYNRIKSFEDDIKIDKEKSKNEAIKAFIESCLEKYKTLTHEEIKEHTLFVLNRTIANVERLKRKDER